MTQKLKTLAQWLVIILPIIAAMTLAISSARADYEPPSNLEVTAVYRDGDTLRIEVTDGTSGGVSAVEVNLADYVGSQYITIQTVSADGSRSEAVRVLNPNYTAPPEQSSTPSEPSAEPQEDAIPDTAFTPNGNGTVKDNATDADGKEFFTIETKDEKIFYLIIDRQRGQENVYFLDTVTVGDLRSLADGGIPEPTATVAPEQSPEPTPPPATTTKGNGTMIFIVIAALGVGGAGFYFKILKPRKAAKNNPEPHDDFNESDYFNQEDDDIL